MTYTAKSQGTREKVWRGVHVNYVVILGEDSIADQNRRNALAFKSTCALVLSWIYTALVAEKSTLYIDVHVMISSTPIRMDDQNFFPWHSWHM